MVKPEDNAETLSNRPNQTLVSTQTITHEYLTLSGKVVRETVRKNGSVTDVMDFVYDESGRPFALIHQTDGVGITLCTYYYVLNLQGDVVKLVTASGDVVANYEYDAWGNILSQSGELAYINPLRYRGYYYDVETGFYYLQSRYYDPANRRFINADSYASTGQGFVGTNMFAYCGNNPVSRYDIGGEFWRELIGALISGVIDAACTWVTGGSPGDIAWSFFTGAIGSLFSDTSVGTVVRVISGIKTFADSREAGLSFGWSLLMVVLSQALSKGLGKLGDPLADGMTELTFGTGKVLTLGAVEAGILRKAAGKSRGIEQQPHKPPTSTTIRGGEGGPVSGIRSRKIHYAY